MSGIPAFIGVFDADVEKRMGLAVELGFKCKCEVDDFETRTDRANFTNIANFH